MDKLQERTLKAYQEHYDDLLRFALTILKDEYAAQEVVQDLCIKILERNDLFSKVSQDRIRPYFLRAIHRSCLNRIKAEKPTVAMPEDMENLLPYEDPNLLDVGLRELYDQLTESWPEDVRQAFLLHVVAKVPLKEIAISMGIKPNTLNQRIKRWRKKLDTSLLLFLLALMFSE